MLKLDPILLVFQFIGICFVAINKPIPGTIIFIASLSIQFLVALQTSKKLEIEQDVIDDVLQLKKDVQNLTVSVGLGRM